MQQALQLCHVMIEGLQLIDPKMFVLLEIRWAFAPCAVPTMCPLALISCCLRRSCLAGTKYCVMECNELLSFERLREEVRQLFIGWAVFKLYLLINHKLLQKP